MNAIGYALNRIKLAIPPEILTIAFTEYNAVAKSMVSLDEHILATVIRPIVLVDCNIVGGIQTTIPLNQCDINFLNNREFIVSVPKNLTNGKSIITLLSLVSNVLYNQATTFMSMSPLQSAGLNTMNNVGTTNIVQTSRMELIADNLVLIADPTINLVNGMLRCMIENMNNLENINPRSFDAFGELCVKAVKSWIYNYMKVKLNKGYIYGGHELSTVTEIIDSYSDSFNEYREYLNTKWGKIAFINNSVAMDRYVRSMLSNTL